MAAALTEGRAKGAWIKSKRKYALIMREPVARIDHEEGEQKRESEGCSGKFTGKMPHGTLPPLPIQQEMNRRNEFVSASVRGHAIGLRL